MMFKRLPLVFHQTLMYGLGMTLMRSISLLMLPVSTYFLSVAEFGLLELLSTIAILGSVIVNLGLEDALFRFAGQEKTEAGKYKVAANIFTLSLIIAVVSVIALYPLSIMIHTMALEQAQVFTVGAACLGHFDLRKFDFSAFGLVKNARKSDGFFLLTLGRAALQAILSVVFLMMGEGVEGLLLAGLVAALLQALILGILHYRSTGFLSIKNILKVLLFMVFLLWVAVCSHLH